MVRLITVLIFLKKSSGECRIPSDIRHKCSENILVVQFSSLGGAYAIHVVHLSCNLLIDREAFDGERALFIMTVVYSDWWSSLNIVKTI